MGNRGGARRVVRGMITNIKASPEQLRARLERRGYGVHADQNRRKDARALRRDKSYREER